MTISRIQEPLRDAMSHIIATRRKQLGLSLRDIHRKAGIDIGTVSLYEHGKIQSPQIETLVKLSIALDLPFEQLLAPYIAYVNHAIGQ